MKLAEHPTVQRFHEQSGNQPASGVAEPARYGMAAATLP